MELFGQFLIDNWEVISVIFGGSGALGVGGYKGFKAAQKQRDSGQDARIKKNTGDILVLKDDVKEVKSQNKSLKMQLDQNFREDLEFRKDVRELQKDTNKTVKEFSDKFNDFLRKDWVELIKKVYESK